jgi:gluconolactonase
MMKTPLFLALNALLVLNSSQGQTSDLVAEGAELELVGEEYDFTEGPAADGEGNVYFTDQPNNKILRWDAQTNKVTTYMEPAGRANGLYVDAKGNLLAAADEKFELWSIGTDKQVTVLVDDFEGRKLNGPNDLWIDPRGGIYFTDPYYQRSYWTRTLGEIGAQQVYYLSPDKKNLRLVASDLVQPNGIIGSSDGNILYIADIGAGKTWTYKIKEDGTLTDKRLFCEMGSDGMTIDEAGNVYLTGQGVNVFDKTGEQILHLPIPQKWTANITFGGQNKDLLFITASNAVYTLQMKVRGGR